MDSVDTHAALSSLSRINISLINAPGVRHAAALSPISTMPTSRDVRDKPVRGSSGEVGVMEFGDVTDFRGLVADVTGKSA